MEDQKLRFDLSATNAAAAEAQRHGIGFDLSRAALDDTVRWLGLPNKLPEEVHAVIHFDPTLANIQIAHPEPAALHPLKPDNEHRLTFHIWAPELDQKNLTHRTVESLYTHPTLNPPVARQLQTSHTPESLLRSGILSYAAGGTALPFAEHVPNGPTANIALLAGSVALCAWGAYKKLTELSPATTGGTWQYFTDEIVPPIRIVR
jgi:hypothetical protein